SNIKKDVSTSNKVDKNPFHSTEGNVTDSRTHQSGGYAKDNIIINIEPNQDCSNDVQQDDNNEKSIAEMNEYEFIKHMKWDEAEDKSDDCLWGINSPFGGNTEEFDIQGDVLFG